MEFLESILKNKYTEEELTKLATKLDKEFTTSYFWNGWIYLGKVVFSEFEIIELKKLYKCNEIYNHIIMTYGKNETVIKYNLIKMFMNNSDDIGLFEFNVANSRLDIGKINKYSYAYEIKTELDSTVRLQKQIEDYEKMFEFIYVVCHLKHLNDVKEIVPLKVGIKTFTIVNQEVVFKDVREAKRNKSIRKEFLLNSLTSKDYEYIIKKYLRMEDIPLHKRERMKIVDKKLKKHELIDIFKETIKARQSKKWDHIKRDFNMILPIEVQDLYSR